MCEIAWHVLTFLGKVLDRVIRGENEKAVLDHKYIAWCDHWLFFIIFGDTKYEWVEERRAKRNSSFVNEELKVWIRPENGSWWERIWISTFRLPNNILVNSWRSYIKRQTLYIQAKLKVRDMARPITITAKLLSRNSRLLSYMILRSSFLSQ